MAYIAINDKTHADKTALAASIAGALSAAGWELWDDMSGSYYQVWRSNGESGSRPYLYVRVLWSASTVALYCYGYWNSASHTTACGACIVHSGLNPAYPLWMHCNKDFAVIVTRNGTSLGNHCLFGHVTSMPTWAVNTTLTASISAGTSVVLPVSSVDGFLVGANYQIFDPTTGYRQTFACTSVGASSITADAISTVGYASGSIVGTHPFSAFAGAQLTSVASINHYATVYNTTPTAASNACDLFDAVTSAFYRAVAMPLIGFTEKRGFYPPVAVEAGGYPQGFRYLGVLDDGNGLFYVCPPVSSALYRNDGVVANNFDALYVGLLDSGTTSGSNTVATLNDTTKSWTTDQWAGKVVVCTSGAEAGQIRKIVSNTATQLTVSPDFVVIPVSGGYAIAERGYRYYLSTHGFMLREGV